MQGDGGLFFLGIIVLCVILWALWTWNHSEADAKASETAQVVAKAEAAASFEADLANKSSSVVRTYHGNQQQDAVLEFEREAQVFAAHGYTPSSQSWAAGQWGCGAWLLALLLCFVLIGGFVFLYMLIVKPAGTLTVTYVRHGPAAALSQPEPATRNRLLVDRLNQLDVALAAGLISAEEHRVRRIAILDSV